MSKTYQRRGHKLRHATKKSTNKESKPKFSYPDEPWIPDFPQLRPHYK